MANLKMRNNTFMFIIIFIVLFKIVYGQSEIEEPQDEIDISESESEEYQKLIKSTSWNENDTYTITYSNDKFITDKKYILCMEKDPEKDFVILNLTDIQLKDREILSNTEDVINVNKTIAKLVQTVKPDLITVTGDQSYGTTLSLQYVGNLIDHYNIPWAPVFGNHDNQESEIDTSEQAYLYEKEFENCLFQSGPNNLATVESGSIAWGNYIINIVEKDESENNFHVVKSLIFFNSGNNYNYQKDNTFNDQKPINPSNYAMLSSTQKEWYQWAVKEVQKYGVDGKVKSAIFLHIPIYAYNTAFDAAFKSDVDIFDYNKYAKAVKNTNVFQSFTDKSVWREGYENSVGGYRETICSSPYDDHFFEIIQNVNEESDNESEDETKDEENKKEKYLSTDLIVAGHDHINDFIVEYKGVTLAYGLKTGGAGDYSDADLSGGSVILVRSSGKSIIYHQFAVANEAILFESGSHPQKWINSWWIILMNIFSVVIMVIF